MKKMKLLGLIALVPLLGLSPANASSYTYNLIIDTAGQLSLSGTITTDVNTGVLGYGDIMGWDLTITGNGTPLDLKSSNSDKVLVGADFTATPAALYYNYSDSNPLTFGVLGFGTSVGPTTGGVNWTSQAGPAESTFILVLGTVGNAEPRAGNSIIATLAETPLPAALPLFATGLGALGFLGWRRKRKAAADT
jgi:hypothetical protein